MINWNATPEEHEIIGKIKNRARGDINLSMDITACHLNGTPLKLQELYDTDNGNFFHDINGIQKHINRKTGQLEGGFLPRYSK